MRQFCLAALISVAAFAANTEKKNVTFHKDVLPILQTNCQSCHRPGEAAPTSFLTYKETRPLAKAIRAAVLDLRMPPWPADPHVGKFANDRRLSDADKTTLVAWADTGATEGNPKDAKANPAFPEGWGIGTPDMVVGMTEAFDVPASGTLDYTYFILPTNLTEDKWIQMSEGRPGTRAVVHHIIAFIREPGSKWFEGYPVNKGFIPRKGSGNFSTTIAGGYVPGAPPMAYRPGQAMLLKAGSDIVFQMHYTANGQPAKDLSKIGLIFAKEPVKQRVYSLAVQNTRFAIPPGADNHEVTANITLGHDVELLDMQPHMHVRGKAAEMTAIYPTGETEKLLLVPKYDFAWQMSYQLPQGKILPKGTKIVGVNHYDNSPNNKHNPDPKAEVKWGDQSWEEMMINFFSVAVDVNVKPSELIERKPAAPRAD